MLLSFSARRVELLVVLCRSRSSRSSLCPGLRQAEAGGTWTFGAQSAELLPHPQQSQKCCKGAHGSSAKVKAGTPEVLGPRWSLVAAGWFPFTTAEAASGRQVSHELLMLHQAENKKALHICDMYCKASWQ